MKIVLTHATNLLSDKANFQNKILTKGQNNHTKQQIRRRKNSYRDIYLHRDIPKETHKTFRQSDETDGGMDRLIDRHVVGLTEEKTDEQRDIKTKHKQGKHTDHIYCSC